LSLYTRLKYYPPQIWLLFWGSLLGSTGQALVWPFLTIYIRERLDVPLTTITLLFTLQSAMGFAATTVFGPLMDRFGRKWPMVVGLVASGLTLFFMSRAATLVEWAVLLPLYAIVNALFRIGSYTMVADLMGPERRASVYALLRMGDNTGIVSGPALGGFLVSEMYALPYYLGAVLQIALAVLVSLMIHETLSRSSRAVPVGTAPVPAAGGGYGTLLHDQRFLAIWGPYILVMIASSMVWVLLGLHVKENYGINEGRFGLIVGTNAGMVVLLQYATTRVTDRYAPLPVSALGALLYAAGLGAFGLSHSFAGFLAGMVVLTLGEMSLVPTLTALVADIAPAQMRARYMGVFSLSFRIGAGIGPVIGGLLNEHIAPSATWYGGAVICVVAAAGFRLAARRDAIPARARRALSKPLP
jgi:MFS family permease